MLSINTNLSSLIAQSSMKSSTNKLNQAIERMTTGFKINHAKDNAANYSISTNMTTKISTYNVAADNCAMGMDLVTTVSDTVFLMQDKAERLRALCIQARNGIYGASSLAAISTEANSIMAEIERIYSTAQYNDVSLYTGAATEETFAAATFAMTRASGNSGLRDTSSMVTMTQLVAGTISADNEYSISTKDELVALANYVNSGNDTTGMIFVLANDIDLSSISNWIPIGDYSTDMNLWFNGTFDGNGHVIKNLTIDNSTKDWQGLFGLAEEDSEIKNIGIENCRVKGASNVGGLVACSLGSITNCYVTGNVTGSDSVGGLVGDVAGNISNSYTTTDVTGTDNVGGLAGVIECDVSNSYAMGNVSGRYCVGGLVGGVVNMGNYIVSNSYATGDVTGTTIVGGLIGAYIDATSLNVSNSAAVRYDSYATQMTEEEILAIYTPESMGFTEANGWTIVDGQPIFALQTFPDSTPDSELDPIPGGGTGGGSGTGTGTGTGTGNSLPGGSYGVSAFNLQVGLNADSSCQIGFDINFTYDLSVVGADITSNEALAAIDDFLNILSEKQIMLGAVQNRLESALESITVNIENLSSSLSTIRDADIAEVSSHYIQQQILQQASATLLATANQGPAIALQLI